MRAVSECDLCPGITAEVKDVGIFELLLVAICGNTKHDNGITGSDQFMDAALATSPAVIIPAEDVALATPTPGCPTEAVDLYDQVWTEFKK